MQQTGRGGFSTLILPVPFDISIEVAVMLGRFGETVLAKLIVNLSSYNTGSDLGLELLLRSSDAVLSLGRPHKPSGRLLPKRFRQPWVRHASVQAEG